MELKTIIVIQQELGYMTKIITWYDLTKEQVGEKSKWNYQSVLGLNMLSMPL